MNQETFYYVAYCRKCNITAACCIDEYKYRKDTANTVARWIRLGLAVDRAGSLEVDIPNMDLATCSCECE
jgi:hypothetical protein